MKKIAALALVFAYIVAAVYAQEKETYLKLLRDNRMDELKVHLDNWKSAAPDDPEMFIGYFNYYLNLARNSTLASGKQVPPGDEQVFVISDPKTGEKIGYMFGEARYEPENAEKALQVINEGLSVAPYRLDMHFGKARLLSWLHAFELQKNQLLAVLDTVQSGRNEWYWSNDEKVDDPEQMLLFPIHDYVAEWFRSGNDTAYECAPDICEALIECFPDSPVGYNDYGLYYAQKGDLDSAEKYFLAGHKVVPGDEVLISNLAYLYESAGDIPEAVRYYELMEKSENREDSACASEKLKQLRR